LRASWKAIASATENKQSNDYNLGFNQ
jgi:hypothetical protein